METYRTDMRVLIGVDAEGLYRPALDMVLRLGFKDLEIHIVHVVVTVYMDSRYPDPGRSVVMTKILDDICKAGTAELERAAKIVTDHGVACQSEQLFGETVALMLDYADTRECDLVAVGSNRKDAFNSLFFGSVGKGIVAGATQSVLVVKQPVDSEQGLTAVVATDHSEYADRCMNRFMEFGVDGVEKAVVVSAFGIKKRMADRYQEILEGASDLEMDVVRNNVEIRTTALCHQLEGQIDHVSGKVVEGAPKDVIAGAVQSSGADLVVMGAQGSGFLKRLTLGSVSFHQVVGTEHNVLIVRA